MSEVSICNLGLQNAEISYLIESLDEGSPEADFCKVRYPFLRDKLLEAFLWNFAKRSVNLALLEDTYPEWDYAYQYPTDCHKAWYLYDENYADPPYYFNPVRGRYDIKGSIEFEIRVNAALSRRVVVTNQEDAVLIYCARISDATLFSTQFEDALSWLLGSVAAKTLSGDQALSEANYKRYLYELSQAKTSNANEQNIIQKPFQKYLDARR